MNLALDILAAIKDQPSDAHRPYVGASSIGRECERAIYYDYHNAPSADFEPKTKIAFEVGKSLEGIILNYIKMAGYQLILPEEKNKFLAFKDKHNDKFQGHLDAILVFDNKKYIVEIKTAKASRFQMFVKSGIRKFSETYYAQLQSYMGMSGIHRSVILVMNKDAHDLHCQWIDFDENYYENLQRRAMKIIHAEEPPERINNSPFYDVCNRCKFREVCFFNAVRPLTPAAKDSYVDKYDLPTDDVLFNDISF